MPRQTFIRGGMHVGLRPSPLAAALHPGARHDFILLTRPAQYDEGPCVDRLEARRYFINRIKHVTFARRCSHIDVM